MPAHQQRLTLRHQIVWLPILLLAWLGLILAPAQAAPAAQENCAAEMAVHNVSQLNNAIACFNGAVTPGEYTITLADDILITTSTRIITKASPDYSLRIDGATHRVDGQNNSGARPFMITGSARVTLQSITITRGNASDGGGIYNTGTLTIYNSTISYNTASGGNGSGQGGGIYNRGTLTIHNSTIISNTASFYGGGIYNEGPLTIYNSTISHNSADWSGGGIGNWNGTLAIYNSTFSKNSTANNAGGGIYQGGGETTLVNTIIANSPSGGDCVLGGGTITASRSLFSHDASDACGLSDDDDSNLIGYAALLDELRDNGGPTWTHALLDGSPAIDAGNNSLIPAQTLTDQRGAGFLRIVNGTVDIGAVEFGGECLPFPRMVSTPAALNNAILCYNTMDQPGEYLITLADDISLNASTTPINNATPGVSLLIDGATHRIDGQNILDVRPFQIEAGTVVSMQAITVTGRNVIGSGGGIYNAGTLTLINSTFSRNTANSSGGIFNKGKLTIHNSTFSKNTASFDGGVIWNSGPLIIRNSTFSDNSATEEGGGIYNLGALTMINSTLSSNTADYGGGIYNEGSLTIYNSTFSKNSASNYGGGGIASFLGTITLANTIIANSPSGGDCIKEWTTIDASHTLISQTGSNACDLSAGANHNLTGVDPQLGPLQDNGGPTFTHALRLGSPTIDAGDNSVCADLNTVNGVDQRGVNRPQGTSCDIGAYEADTGLITFSKQVVGGTAQPSAWTFSLATYPTPIIHTQTVTLSVGSYVVNEFGPATYIPTAASGACALVNGQFQLTVTPHSATCTITNTLNVGPITFINQVVGGAAQPSAWTFTVAGDPTAIPHNGIVTLTVGNYTVTAVGPAEYILTGASGACTLNNGQVRLTVTNQGGICTITNTRQTGQVTFSKQVASGTAQPSAWTFTLNSGPEGATLPANIPHNSVQILDTGVYTLVENGPVGYELVNASGACQVVNGQLQLTIAPGNSDCTIVNRRSNEGAGLEVVAETPIQLSEGTIQAAQHTASYQVRLTSQPTNDVTVLVNVTGPVTVSPSNLTFTPENWETFQSVTLSIADDAIDQGVNYDATISHTVSSADPAYNGLVGAELPVLILDDDEAGVLITPSTITVTVGVTSTYNVVLTSQPLNPVQIVFTPAGPFRINGSCADADAPCLTFTPENWNVPQTFSIFGLTTGSGQITYQVVSDDPLYTGLTATPVAVNVVASEPP